MPCKTGLADGAGATSWACVADGGAACGACTSRGSGSAGFWAAPPKRRPKNPRTPSINCSNATPSSFCCAYTGAAATTASAKARTMPFA